jgi:hypothetical protein
MSDFQQQQQAIGETGKTCGLDGIQVDCGWIFRGAQGIAGDGGSGSEVFSQCETATCGGFAVGNDGNSYIFYEDYELGEGYANHTAFEYIGLTDAQVEALGLCDGCVGYGLGPSFSPQGTGGSGGSGCGATQAVSFIKAHQADAALVAKQLGIPTQNVLGLSGIESTWGTSNIATSANNFFGLHGGANAPFANGAYVTSGGVQMSAFPSYLASAQSFAAQYGSFVSGVVDPTKFAQALVSAGFNPGKLPLGNPDFVKDTARTINATKGRMGCS